MKLSNAAILIITLILCSTLLDITNADLSPQPSAQSPTSLATAPGKDFPVCLAAGQTLHKILSVQSLICQEKQRGSSKAEKMKDSSVFPGFESFNTANNGRNSSEYDVKTDFKEILEEAKKYAKEKKQEQAIEEKSGKKQASSSGVKKGGKKSWKTALLSFWKSSSTKKAKKQAKETPKQRGNVSGPIHGGVGGAATAIGGGYWPRLAFSGPLTNMFHQRKREDDIPYVNLELNEPEYDAKTYGPVYSVP